MVSERLTDSCEIYVPTSDGCVAVCCPLDASSGLSVSAWGITSRTGKG